MAGFKAHSRYSSSDPVPESVSCEYPDPRDLNASLPVTNDLFSKTLRCGLLDAVPALARADGTTLPPPRLASIPVVALYFAAASERSCRPFT